MIKRENYNYFNSNSIGVLLSLFFCSMTLFGCSSSSSDGSGQNVDSDLAVNIIVEVTGLPAGGCFLGGVQADQYYTLDSLSVENGNQIRLTRKRPYSAGLYYLILPDGKTNIQLLLYKDQKFVMNCDISDVVATMEVDGSVDNELFYNNLRYESDYRREYNRLREAQRNVEQGSEEHDLLEKEKKELVSGRMAHIYGHLDDYPNSFFTIFKVSGQNPTLREPRGQDGKIDKERQVFLYRKEYWKNMDFSSAALLRTPVYHNKMKNFIEKVVPQQADSLIKWADFLTTSSMENDTLFKYTANWIGVKYKEPTFMGGDAVYAHLVKKFFTNELAFWSDENEIRLLQQDATIRQRSMIGAKGADLRAEQPDGNFISLYNIDAELIVFYIYTVTCDNCRKETPKVVKVYNEWKERGVKVLALSMDDDYEAWNKYINKNNMDWYNIIDPDYESGYNFKYHTDITPEIYVLNRDFEIVGKDLKADQLPTIFKRHL